MHQPPSTAPDRLTSQRMADSSGTATSMPQIRDTLTTFFSDTQPTCQTDPANAGAAVDSMIKEDMCRTQSRDQQIEEVTNYIQTLVCSVLRSLENGVL